MGFRNLFAAAAASPLVIQEKKELSGKFGKKQC
jgi:hypothetical protein